MPLSASLAARMTRVSLAAISPATVSAASSSAFARDDLEDRAVRHQVGSRDRAAGEVERAHQVLGDQAGEVRGGAERSAVDLRDAEVGVVAGDHGVGVADEADATAEAEAVHGRDDRDGALVDGLEGREAAAVGADERVEAAGLLHLLDVDARVEALALRAQHDGMRLGVPAGLVEGRGQVEPAGDRQRVDRREVDRDDPDVVVAPRRRDAHATFLT